MTCFYFKLKAIVDKAQFVAPSRQRSGFAQMAQNSPVSVAIQTVP
jgi:hypothetical protein